MPGDGRAGVRGGSPRLYFNVLNKNVLFEAEVFVESDAKECYLVARSDHEDRPDGKGGYYLYLNFHDKKMYFKKEQTHVIGYSPRLNQIEIDFSPNKWHTASIEVQDVENGRVQITGTFDNVSTLLFDEGQITCGNETHAAQKYPPFTERGKWCFLRTNEPKDVGTLNKKPGVYYRNVKITNLG